MNPTETVFSPFTGNVFRRPVPERLQSITKPVLPKPLTAAAPPPKPNVGNLSADLSRILRPQAAYRWLLPQLAQITPQYVELTLRGALAGNHVQAWELFDLMQDTWPELAGCCQELIEGVQRKTLVFDAYQDEDVPATPEALEKKKIVAAAINSMRPDSKADENDRNGTIKDILSAWFQGTTVLEVYWDDLENPGSLNTVTTSTGQEIIAPRSTGWVHPVCYAWSMEGLLGLRAELDTVRMTTQTYSSAAKSYRGSGGSIWNTTAYEPRPSVVQDFPPNKFLIAIQKQKSGTALGGALLRVLAWWWCAANFSAEWLMNLAQLFGLPIRWANFDLNAPQETIDAICQMLENMGSAAWGAFPAGTKIEILEQSKGSDHSPQGELLDRADRYARMVILGQTMTGSRRGMSGGGGPGFGGVEKDVKEDRIEAAGSFACGVINNQLIPFILEVNYGKDGLTEMPTCRLLAKEEGGLEDAQRDTTLAQGGLEIPKSYLRQKYRIPEPAKGEETIGGVAASPKRNGQSPKSGNGNSNNDDPDDDSKDGLETQHRSCNHGAAPLHARHVDPATAKLADNVLENLTGIEARWLGGVKPFFQELLAKAKDGRVSDAELIKAIEHGRKQIPELFHKLDTKALSDAMERTMSAAAINGAARGHMARKSKVQSPKSKVEEVANA